MKAALIGCGRIGTRHASILADLPETQLAAFVDTDPTRAKRFSERHGGQAYTDLAAMVRAESPDLVSVCTPSGNHAEMVIAAARARVPNIVVEKPMALKLSDADAMIQECDTAGARLFVVQQNRYNLPIVKLRE